MKYKYVVLRVRNKELQTDLNKAAENGWRLVSYNPLSGHPDVEAIVILERREDPESPKELGEKQAKAALLFEHVHR